MTHYEKAIEKYGLVAVDVEDYLSILAFEKTKWVDQDGYQYFLSRENLSSCGTKNGRLSRYFNGNIYTVENVKRYVADVTDGDVVVVDFQAKNAHDKILFYSKKQDRTYEKSFNSFTHNPYCVRHDPDYRNPKSHTIELIKHIAENKYDITIVSRAYKDNQTPLQFMCNKAEHRHKMQRSTWATMQSSPQPCKYCRMDAFQKKVVSDSRALFWENYRTSRVVNPHINVIGEYTGAHTKIECKCTKCGEAIQLRPDHILRGIGCGKCVKSLGEALIEQYLIKRSVQFNPQHIFPDCKMSKRAMPFDFYIPAINLAIEYDGQQHFEPYGRFGGDGEFKRIAKRDSFKTEYCMRNSISLLRIPYTSIEKIPEILNQYIASTSNDNAAIA